MTTLIKEFKTYLIKESLNNAFICVDIQPEYEDYIIFDISEWIEYLNNTKENILFLYNGESMGTSTENEYIDWLYLHGLDENVINCARFYDKGYGYFRSCIDNDIENESIVKFIKFMIEEDVHTTHEINEDFWLKFNNKFKNLSDLIDESDDYLNIPDLIGELKYLNNITVCGGDIDECLKEVEIALMVLNKPYEINNEFTY